MPPTAANPVSSTLPSSCAGQTARWRSLPFSAQPASELPLDRAHDYMTHRRALDSLKGYLPGTLILKQLQDYVALSQGASPLWPEIPAFLAES